jgi:hypothetical protein
MVLYLSDTAGHASKWITQWNNEENCLGIEEFM